MTRRTGAKELFSYYFGDAAETDELFELIIAAAVNEAAQPDSGDFVGYITDVEAMRNVAEVVMQLTEVAREHNGRGRSKTYAGDIDAIAGAARQLAEMVIEATGGDAPPNNPETYSEDIPF